MSLIDYFIDLMINSFALTLRLFSSKSLTEINND